jgi:hypothetical protein
MAKFYFSLLLILAHLIQGQTYQWAKSICSTSLDISQSIAIDLSGNIYSTGFFLTNPDFDPGPLTYTVATAGSMDIYISKLDASGNFIWVKTIGSNGQDMSHSIFVDGSGNFYVTGNFQYTVDFDPGPGVTSYSAPMFTMGSKSAFVCKYDLNGNFIWAKAFTGKECQGQTVQVDASGNVYTTGYFSGVADFDAGPGTYTLDASSVINAFVTKMDANGNLIWAKNIGNSSSNVNGGRVLPNPSGDIYVTGTFNGTTDFDPGPGILTIASVAGSSDIFLLKLDAAGNFIWVKTFGGAGYDDGGSIKRDVIGNIYFGGTFTGTVDFDPGPATMNLISNGGRDGFIIKLDQSANLLWAKNVGSSNDDYCTNLELDASKYVYMTGSFQNTVDFDPGPGTNNITSSGNFDIYILKLDSSGIFTWVKPIGGTGGDEYCYSLSLDGVGNLCATGIFSVTTNFDAPATTNALNVVGEYDVFIAKYSTTNFGIEEVEIEKSIMLYPNPVIETINLGKVAKEINVYDVNGRLIKNMSNLSSLNVSELSEGIYFLRIKTSEGECNKKFIKE